MESSPPQGVQSQHRKSPLYSAPVRASFIIIPSLPREACLEMKSFSRCWLCYLPVRFHPPDLVPPPPPPLSLQHPQPQKRQREPTSPSLLVLSLRSVCLHNILVAAQLSYTIPVVGQLSQLSSLPFRSPSSHHPAAPLTHSSPPLPPPRL